MATAEDTITTIIDGYANTGDLKWFEATLMAVNDRPDEEQIFDALIKHYWGPSTTQELIIVMNCCGRRPPRPKSNMINYLVVAFVAIVPFLIWAYLI